MREEGRREPSERVKNVGMRRVAAYCDTMEGCFALRGKWDKFPAAATSSAPRTEIERRGCGRNRERGARTKKGATRGRKGEGGLRTMGR